MIRVTGVTLVNGVSRRLKEVRREFSSMKEVDEYKKRIKTVMQRRLKHDVYVDLTRKDYSD